LFKSFISNWAIHHVFASIFSTFFQKKLKNDYLIRMKLFDESTFKERLQGIAEAWERLKFGKSSQDKKLNKKDHWYLDCNTDPRDYDGIFKTDVCYHVHLMIGRQGENGVAIKKNGKKHIDLLKGFLILDRWKGAPRYITRPSMNEKIKPAGVQIMKVAKSIKRSKQTGGTRKLLKGGNVEINQKFIFVCEKIAKEIYRRAGYKTDSFCLQKRKSKYSFQKRKLDCSDLVTAQQTPKNVLKNKK
jgi:hypothetical protein